MKLMTALLAGLALLAPATASALQRNSYLVSQPGPGIPDPNSGDAHVVGISANGAVVVFQTTQRLVAQDNDGGLSDLYVRANGTTTLASGPTGVGDPAKAAPAFRAISADGSQIFFTTTERLDPADNDGGKSDVYVHTVGGGTNLISQSTGVTDPGSAGVSFARASRDGSRVAFVTTQKMTADDHNNAADVYVRAGGVTSLVSVCPFNDGSPDAVRFAGATPDLSAVAFETNRRCVSGDQDSNRQDVYVRSGGATTWASAPIGVKDANTGPVNFDRISQDGVHVIMTTNEPLVPGDGDKVADVYDHTSGGTALVSQATGVADPGANGPAAFAGASADGTRIFFESNGRFTPDDGDSARRDVFVRAGGQTALVSVPSGVPDPNTAGVALDAVSQDGATAVFSTTQRMTTDDNDSGRTDVYVRRAGITALVSGPTGVSDPNSAGATFRHLSLDGSRVLFTTTQSLTADDQDPTHSDVYENAGGATVLVSKGAAGVATGSGDVSYGGASEDGLVVAFSTVRRLTSDDTDAAREDAYFALDLVAPETSITGAPNHRTRRKVFQFFFSAGEPATFQCKIDRGPWRACSSGYTVRNLRNGSHTFRVRASDGLHTEPTPALWRFTVDRTGPRIDIHRGPYTLGRRDHKVRIRIGCRRTEVARCRAVVALTLGRQKFGTKAFSVRPGRTATVAVLVPRAARDRLFRAGTLRVRATVTARDDLRNRSRTVRLVTLQKP